MNSKSRRLFLRKLLLGGAAAALSGGSYVGLVEPEWISVDNVQIPFFGGSQDDSIRIVHMSDLHASPSVSYEYLESTFKLALEQEPDLICMTGDYISKQLYEREKYIELFKMLSNTVPVYASFGNHDGGAWAAYRKGYATVAEMVSVFLEAEITILINEIADIKLKGKEFRIAGMGDYWAKMLLPDEVLAPVNEHDGLRTILLSHNPDSKDQLKEYHWDLMLSGHTHGGQVKIPFFGPPIVPVRDRRFVEGLHKWDGRYLYITRGVGNLHNIRFNCRPQVSVLNLT